MLHAERRARHECVHAHIDMYVVRVLARARRLHGIIKLWCQIKAASQARRRPESAGSPRRLSQTHTTDDTSVCQTLAGAELNHQHTGQPEPKRQEERLHKWALSVASGAVCHFLFFVRAAAAALGLCALSLTFIMTHTRAGLN